MHAIVRFRSDCPATHMITVLDQAERYGIAVHWEELATEEEDGRLYPTVDVEWDHTNTSADKWFGFLGIDSVFLEDEA